MRPIKLTRVTRSGGLQPFYLMPQAIVAFELVASVHEKVKAQVFIDRLPSNVEYVVETAEEIKAKIDAALA